MSKKTIFMLLGGIVAAAWIATGIAFGIGAEKSTIVIVLTITALVTEIAIWLAAATMGVAVFEARARIAKKVKSLFARKQQANS